MKKILLALVITLLGSSSYAQWTQVGSSSSYYINGYAGVGGAAPSEALTLSNPNVAYDASSGETKIRFDSGGGAGGIGFAKESYNTGGLRFYTQYGYGSMLEKMRITANGNVGIGTTSPATALHVYGSTPFRAETSSGNVKTGFEMSSAYFGGVGSGLYFYPGGPSTGNNSFGENVNNSIETNVVGISGGIMKVGTAGPQTTQLYTNSLPRLSITSVGNVGVGTTSPDEKLTVNGTIHSTEVKVTVSVPPDYVFEPDYSLKDLGEVKAYVDKNHHLPEIPSAAQMEKDGIGLGDMNMKLLKKVEELTLHLIRQNARIEKLEKQLKTKR